MAFTNTLPDPNNPITPAGATTGTGPVNGPGYSSVSVKSVLPSIVTTTNSGSTIVRNIAGHKWQLNISYNPLTRAEFEPLHGFLLQKKGGTAPFFVSLPQYTAPQDTAFNTFVTSNNFAPSADVAAGSDRFEITHTSYSYDTGDTDQGLPSVGDIFSVTDSGNTNHKKVYMITRVETKLDQSTGALAATNLRIHFTPPLQKSVESTTSTIKFKDVQFRVINKSSDIGYSLDSNNLYKLSLKLEEAQP